jgi:hypothetical protein
MCLLTTRLENSISGSFTFEIIKRINSGTESSQPCEVANLIRKN